MGVTGIAGNRKLHSQAEMALGLVKMPKQLNKCQLIFQSKERLG